MPMTLSAHLLAVLCVAMIAAGQVLFKQTAEALTKSGTFLDATVLSFGSVALAIYGTATVFWILLLQHAPLSRLYPYMALSFVFVALVSWLLLNEHIPAAQIAGLAFIVGGLLLIATS
jgi:drug/metabolite transporter (DMT)-like permease